MRMAKKIIAVAWLAGGCAAAWAAGPAGRPLALEWGVVETTGDAARAAFQLLKSSAVAPVTQHPTGRGTVPWLVQFEGAIREEWKAALESAGAVPHGYVPEDALLVEAAPEALPRIAALAGVAWVGEYLPAYKFARTAGALPAETQEYLVALFRPADKPRIARELGERNVFVPRADAQPDHDLFRVRLSPEQAGTVANWGEVEWIEPCPPLRAWAAAAAPAAPSAVEAAPVVSAWTGKGQVLAANDRGVDAAHPDLADRVVDLTEEEMSGVDVLGHGTLLAGAAIGDGTLSGGRFAGAAPEANLVMQGMHADRAGQAVDLEAVLLQAYENEARIHLEGWGRADGGRYGLEARAVDRFVWGHPDMLVVAAAGNAAVDLKPADGVVDAGSVGSPATAKNALAVGAAEGRRPSARVWRDSWPGDFAVEPIALDPMAQAEGPEGLAAFSGRGPCADGRIKPDLVAPGTYVVSVRSRQAEDEAWGVADDTNYLFAGGTSLAAAQVAGAAAQTRQWLAETRGLDAPPAALVKALLVNAARDLAPGQYGVGAKQEIPAVRPNGAQGFGRLDVARALGLGEGEFLETREGDLAPGAADEFEWPVAESGGRFIVTLAYSDRPAAPAAGRKLVNDLDLTVKKPSGEVLHPNGRMTPDNVNNVEMIEFEADAAGVCAVRVAARNVPMGGSQPYALVVRGPRTPAAPAAATVEIP